MCHSTSLCVQCSTKNKKQKKTWKTQLCSVSVQSSGIQQSCTNNACSVCLRRQSERRTDGRVRRHLKTMQRHAWQATSRTNATLCLPKVPKDLLRIVHERRGESSVQPPSSPRLITDDNTTSGVASISTARVRPPADTIPGQATKWDRWVGTTWKTLVMMLLVGDPNQPRRHGFSAKNDPVDKAVAVARATEVKARRRGHMLWDQ